MDDYKGMLQTHNSMLTSNNSDLMSILDKVNSIQINTTEDLSTELDSYSSGLTTQENTIDDILSALENKASGGGDTSAVEDAFIAKTLTGDYVNNRVTTIGNGAMSEQPITSACFGEATYIDERGFYGCQTLTSVTLPKVTYLGTSAFQNCSAITSFYIPLVTQTSSSVFRNCTSLTSIVISLLTTASTYLFNSCTSLKRADLGTLKSIGAYSFTNCAALDTLILRKTDAICTLANTTNVFTGTPIASGTGYIYVPDALVNSYKTATNWSTYAAQIKGLSELSGPPVPEPDPY